MGNPQGYMRIWAWYVTLRTLLVIRYYLETLHLWVSEMPIWAIGSAHSYTMYILFLIWEHVNLTLFHVDNYLRYETYAEEFLWMPRIQYNPIGYG